MFDAVMFFKRIQISHGNQKITNVITDDQVCLCRIRKQTPCKQQADRESNSTAINPPDSFFEKQGDTVKPVEFSDITTPNQLAAE